MQRDCLCEHIITYTAHLYSVWSKEFASIHKAVTLESHWIVSFVGYEHTDDAFVSINDEVAPEFIHILLLINQLGLSEPAQIAVFRSYHDRDFTDTDIDLLGVLVVDAPAESCIEGRLVCERPHATLGGIDVLLFVLIAHY